MLPSAIITVDEATSIDSDANVITRRGYHTWGLVEKARDIGFEVELLSPELLNPTDLGMDENCSLVCTLCGLPNN